VINCYLCGTDAEVVRADEQGQQVSCVECGEYVISNIVVRELQHKSLDFPAMRDDLHRQRQYNATVIARIDSESAKWSTAE